MVLCTHKSYKKLCDIMHSIAESAKKKIDVFKCQMANVAETLEQRSSD